MSYSLHAKIFIFARLFTACAALLLLTMTVMQRADPDGYQATHLFFMPSQDWQMDDSAAILHDQAHYASVDTVARAAQASADYRWLHQSRSIVLPSLQVMQSYQLTLTGAYKSASQQPALANMRPLLNLSGNTIAIEQSGASYLWEMGQSTLLLLTVIVVTIWLADIPSPPPRSSHSKLALLLVPV